MADISKITLPDGQSYNIKDANAVTSVNGKTGSVVLNVEDIGVTLSNPNIIHNWHFTVNQREVTSGTTTYNKYNLDRWQWDYTGSAGTFSVGARSVTVTPSSGNAVILSQPLENPAPLVGKVLTATIQLYNGNSYSGTITRESNTTQYFFTENNPDKVSINLSSANKFRVICYEAKTIMAVKLEYGSSSTLINDPDPDYATELLKCQRFFVRKTVEGNGFLTSSGNNRYWVFDLPTEMRATPAVSLSGKIIVRGTTGYDNSFPLAGGTPTSMTILQLKGGTCHVGFVQAASNLTNNTPISFGYASGTNGIVDLTADL